MFFVLSIKKAPRKYREAIELNVYFTFYPTQQIDGIAIQQDIILHRCLLFVWSVNELFILLIVDCLLQRKCID